MPDCVVPCKGGWKVRFAYETQVLTGPACLDRTLAVYLSLFMRRWAEAPGCVFTHAGIQDAVLLEVEKLRHISHVVILDPFVRLEPLGSRSIEELYMLGGEDGEEFREMRRQKRKRRKTERRLNLLSKNLDAMFLDDDC
jgi:hypothetical protein